MVKACDECQPPFPFLNMDRRGQGMGVGKWRQLISEETPVAGLGSGLSWQWPRQLYCFKQIGWINKGGHQMLGDESIPLVICYKLEQTSQLQQHCRSSAGNDTICGSFCILQWQDFHKEKTWGHSLHNHSRPKSVNSVPGTRDWEWTEWLVFPGSSDTTRHCGEKQQLT